MATIDKRVSVRVGKDGKPIKKTKYRVRVRLQGQTTRTKTFSKLDDAKKWAKRVEVNLEAGQWVPTRELERRTVSQMVEKYIDDYLPIKRHNKDARHTTALLNWWKVRIGDYSMVRVTPALLVECRDELARGKTHRGKQRSTATVNRYLSAIGHALKIASQEWHWIPDNPARKVGRLQESEERVRFLDDDERKRLLEACRSSQYSFLYPIVLLALSTGARQGELLNLRWPQIDLQAGRVVLHDTKNRDRRVLHLYGPAKDELEKLAKVRRIDTDLVFPGRNPQRPKSLKEPWKDAVERAQLEDFRFHDLRHSAASYLAMNGATLAEIAAILGHKTLQMVKRYSHIADNHAAAVVERMNKEVFK